MRHILASVFLVVLLFPALALGGEIKYEDLVVREALFYKKYTDIPFTGKVTGNRILGLSTNTCRYMKWQMCQTGLLF